MMGGGRGASSGISVSGKPYGSEFRTLLKVGNIKFVQYKDSSSAKSPQETMTRGRIYVTVTDSGKLKHVTYYDEHGKRAKQIDLDKAHKGVAPHTHHGYEHNEKDTTKGFANLTTQEKKLLEKVNKLWHNQRNSKR